jgi:6-phosphogluconolactonase
VKRLEKNGARIEVWRDLAGLSERGAELLRELAEQSIEHQSGFYLALSGGSTPKALFNLLGSDLYAKQMSHLWRETQVFWTDERCVPPDDPQSNYRMAHESLLSRVDLQASQIHRMRGEDEPERAAMSYALDLNSAFKMSEPVFDLILLGMGADAHTASIFPHSPLLTEGEVALVAAPYVDKLQAYRLTLTLRVLNRARNIIFLVSGREKAEPLRKVFASLERDEEVPARWVRPVNGACYWLVDEEAAALLD